MFLFFDTETTGLPKNWKAPINQLSNWPRLVQIAWISTDEEAHELECFDSIIKPEGFKIPEEVSKIHGITTDYALEVGQPLTDILIKFSNTAKKNDFLVAHNLSFDEKIIGAEFLRAKLQCNLSKKTKICTKQSSTNFCKIPGNYGYKWPTLSELYKILFNKTFAEAHNAVADVEACMKCFFELKAKNIIKPAKTNKL
ncbi:MAG: 3'-5' exonuclease [Candidatus Caenarcaniphilales bacterium]|nr:3'-5' exonuclease [Candidatus Caenarcaniphilales bacterium]